MAAAQNDTYLASVAPNRCAFFLAFTHDWRANRQLFYWISTDNGLKTLKIYVQKPTGIDVLKPTAISTYTHLNKTVKYQKSDRWRRTCF